MHIPEEITDFSRALVLLKQGRCVQRVGWNVRGIWLYLVPGSTFVVNRPPLSTFFADGRAIEYLPHIDMRTADGKFVPWLASQTDILATDWIEVEPA
jgi:hypothetical protein